MLPIFTEQTEMIEQHPPKQSSQLWEEGFWTHEAVVERLTDALRLWWRSPGEGKWPFASDAPWHLMTRRTRLTEAGYKQGRELQLHLQSEDADEVRRREGRDDWGPLSRDDVSRRDEATEWLTWVRDEDRRLVILALTMLAAGRARVDWMGLKGRLGVKFGADGLRKRFSRAIQGVAERLNQGSMGAKPGS